MKRATERGVIILGLMLAGGCQETRLVSCVPRRPAVEAQSYDIHDPFPDDEIGPNTFSRPRTFDVPRSDTRKTFDLRNLQAAKFSATQSQAYWNPGTPRANASVQPIWRQQGPAASVAADNSVWDDTLPRYNVVPQ